MEDTRRSDTKASDTPTTAATTSFGLSMSVSSTVSSFDETNEVMASSESSFAHFQQTYGPALEECKTTSDDEDEPLVDAVRAEDTYGTLTWREWTFSICLPILVQILSGTVNLIRSLILGQVVQLIITHLSAPQWLKESAVWRHSLLFLGNDGKADPKAWPPPALILLAILTIVALVVHPDGFTWILLRKIRDTMYSLLQNLATCWALVVDDYGAILSTILALATFASLFFFVYVLHKTLSPRTPAKQRQHNPEKQKKKKRKGNNSARGRSGRIKGTQRTRATGKNVPQTDPVPTVPSENHERKYTTIGEQHERKDLTTGEEQRKDTTMPLPALLEDKPVDPPLTIAPSLPQDIVKESEQPDLSRVRATSSSTADTNPLSDDLSCESVSGRSTPVAVAASENPSSLISDETTKSKPKGKSTGPSRSTSSRKQQTRRGKTASNSDLTPGPNAKPAKSLPRADSGPASPSTPSRWDALKPASARPGSRRGHGAKGRSPNVQAPPRTKQPQMHSNELFAPALAEHPAQSVSDRVAPQPYSDRVELQYLPPSPANSLFSYQDSSIGVTHSALNTHAAQQSFHTPVVGPSVQTPIRRPRAENHLVTPNSAHSDEASFFSTLNSQSPSPAIQTNASPAGPLRAPPGLAPIERITQPMHQMREEPLLSQGLSLPPGASPPFRPKEGPVYHVKENPFASDDDDDQIEAELQELGGQMVGSILDF